MIWKVALSNSPIGNRLSSRRISRLLQSTLPHFVSTYQKNGEEERLRYPQYRDSINRPVPVGGNIAKSFVEEKVALVILWPTGSNVREAGIDSNRRC